MNYVAILTGALKFANWLFGWLHDQGLISATEDAMVARQLTEMAQRSKTLQAIDAKFAGATPDEVMKELEGDFRD